jgi:hypothetical protein
MTFPAECGSAASSSKAFFLKKKVGATGHLRVLLDAVLATEQRHGRARRYRLVPAQLRPVRDWIAYYERFRDE